MLSHERVRDEAEDRMRKDFPAMFMVLLIISMPFYSSKVLADLGSLSDVKVTGMDQKDGMLSRKGDSLQVSAIARMIDSNSSPLPVTSANMRLVISGKEYSFGNCSDTGSGYLCNYAGPSKEWSSGKYYVTVKLLGRNNVRLAQVQEEFFVDGMPPRTTFQMEKEGASYRFSIDVRDTACPACGSLCIGLDKADIVVNGTVKKTVALSGCTSQTGFLASAAELGIKDGTQEICIVAYDLSGLSSSACHTFFSDATKPGINGQSIQLLDQNGFPLAFSKNTPINAKLIVNVSEDTSGIASVTANLSALNPAKGDAYAGLAGSCEGSPTLVCSWPSIQVYNPANPAIIQITAVDNAGNDRTEQWTARLPFDSTPPALAELSTGYPGLYKKAGNVFVAEIIESGSGMRSADVFLNLHSLNPSYGYFKADNCSISGDRWICVWPPVNAVSQSDDVKVIVTEMRDAAGNLFRAEDESNVVYFDYDGKAPEIMNLTIYSLGTGLDVIRTDDIAELRAIIAENESGLIAEHVLADFSVFGQDWTQADSCDYDNETGRYTCLWQYPGPFEKGPIKIEVRAMDMAGNAVDSSDRRLWALGHVVDTIERDVDFWQDKASVGMIQPMNRNYIIQTSAGALQRFSFELAPKGSAARHVHGIEVKQCQGSFQRENEPGVYGSFSVKGQYYLPGQSRSGKYVIIGVPYYDKEGMENVTEIQVNCTAEIYQGASKTSPIFSPNEKVSIEFVIPLLAGVFEEPADGAIDKINEKKEQIKTLEMWINNINMITSWLGPLCKLLQTIRTIIDGLTIILKGISSVYKPVEAAYQAMGQFRDNVVYKFWFGYDYKGGEAGGQFGSRKNFVSVGFWCDLVLCEDCNNFWNEKIGAGDMDWFNDFSDKVSPDSTYPYDESSMTPQDRQTALASQNPKLFFDPTKSLIVAVICWPPCLTGIEAKLQVYKSILTTYNACMNVAAIRGEDVGQCEEYLSSQICQQIIGEFWYIIDGFIRAVIVKWAMWLVREKILDENSKDCTVESKEYPCWGVSIMRIIGWFLTVSSTFQAINELMNHEYFQMNSDTNQQDAEDHVNDELDNDGLGSFTQY
jgi:hypothetical protein